MDLGGVLDFVRRSWIYILVCGALGLGAGALLMPTTPTSYTSMTVVYFSVEGAPSASDQAAMAMYAERQIRSYAEAANSGIVKDRVARRAGLASAADVPVVALAEPASSLIRLTATGEDPSRSAKLANLAADELISVTNDLSAKDGKGHSSTTATVFQNALPGMPAPAGGKKKSAAAGLIVGLALGVGTAMVRYLIDNRLRRTEELSVITDAPVLGRISQTTSGATDEGNNDSYLRLSAHLATVLGASHDKSVVLVTAPTTVSNLVEIVRRMAYSFGKPGATVLEVADKFAANSSQINAEADSQAHTSAPNAKASSLRGDTVSAQIADNREKQTATFVVAPPVLSDANFLTELPLADAAILVVERGITKRKDIEVAVYELRQCGAKAVYLVETGVPGNAGPFIPAKNDD